MTLSNAITELRADIIANGFDDAMLADIARDNGVNPALLTRKFTEQFGRAPAGYTAPVDTRAAQIAAAKKIAADYAATFTQQGDVPHGIVFNGTKLDRQFVTVGWAGSYLIVVRVDNGQIRNLEFSNRAACTAFIERKIL